MKHFKVRVKRVWEKLTRRAPGWHHKKLAAISPTPPVCSGNPGVDTILGNEIQLWGEKNAPAHGTLKTCSDGGAELLFQASGELVKGQVSTEPAVFFTGPGAPLLPEESSDGRPLDWEELIPPALENPEVAAKRKLYEMEKQLRRTSCEPFDSSGSRFYIPGDAFESIMTRDAIRTIFPFIAKGLRIAREPEPPDFFFDQLAQDIYGRRDRHGTKIRFRQILAVLILIGKPETVFEFIKYRITDSHLPLQKIGTRPFELGIWDSKQPASIFRNWEDRDIEEFEITQWEMLAPFFSCAETDDNSVRHYELPWHCPLPFEMIEEPDSNEAVNNKASSNVTSSNGSSLDSMAGGYGKVCKVRIHPRHHDLPSYRGNEANPALAIKRLFSADKDNFENEVGILARLNKCNDPHLVKLLLTMEILGDPSKGSSFFLIFPLADSNLRQFWQQNLPRRPETNMVAIRRWVAKQFHGLVFALCKLHDLHQIEVHTGKGPEGADEFKSSLGDPWYGIHGDIKPENLLWYKDWVGPSGALAPDSNNFTGTRDSLGVLQLADFGISQLHHTKTRSEVTMYQSTKTYAPPEIEWAVNDCSRSFDIWSLGCVFLEFLCWLVQGDSEDSNPVDVFQKARYLDGSNRGLDGYTIQDTFYHVVKETNSIRYEVNPAVIELIGKLRKGASTFITNMLDVILFDMLVVEPKKSTSDAIKQIPKPAAGAKKRITCVQLAKKLTTIQQSKDEYFTGHGTKQSERNEQPQTLTLEGPTELIKRHRSMTRTFSNERKNGDVNKCSQQMSIPEGSKELTVKATGR